MASIYSTAQMQLNTCACVLVFQHAGVNMLTITCNGVLASLTYCTSMLHEELHTCMCYLSGYSTAQLQGNEGSRVTCELLASCMRVARELHASY